MNANDLFTAVMQLDLEPIKMKLMHVASGEGWSLEKANAVEKEYRRFLCLMRMYPDEDTAPLVDVDTFWHYHILDTRKYAADCEQAFGCFLHHYPYVGMRGGDDEQFRLDSGNRMRELYEATFGDPYPGTEAADASAARSAAGTGTAWCAGPWDENPKQPADRAVAAGTAWCAGPWDENPKRQAKSAVAAGTAWCAGPWDENPKRQAGSAIAAGTAWCAGPWDENPKRQDKSAIAAGTAWCAGPWDENPKRQAGSAIAAGSHVTREAAANA